MISGHLLARRDEIGSGGVRVLRCFQVPRVEYLVMVGKPVGGLNVERPPAVAQQGPVNAISDQSMNEQKPVAFRADQLMLNQTGAFIARYLDHRRDDRGGEALTQDRCGLNRQAILWVKIVGTCLYDALHRPWYAVLGILLGIAQQLVEEQWIAGGAGDTGACQFVGRVQIMLGEVGRVLRVQRPQIDGGERAIADLGAPPGIDRIALDPGCHQHDDRAAGDTLSEARQTVEENWIGPMNILDPKQDGSPASGLTGQGDDGAVKPLHPGLIVHRVMHGLELSGLWQIQQIIQMEGVLRLHQSTGDGLVGGQATHRLAAARGDAD